MLLRSIKRCCHVLTAIFAILAVQAGMALAETPQRLDLALEEVRVVSGEKTHVFQAEIAKTSTERGRGLMYRKEMAADAGMLFIFDDEGDRYFWMKDTPLSLDIIFIAKSGEIVRIAENTTPFSEKIIASRKPAQYVLEVLAGTSKRLGIKASDRVVSQSISPVE